ncbi:hypothetical protein CW706_02945 [Candidatus Bathyarchaeota archaeon]|nr:MAG: hypothetical protein CW706_02945 [Candidatus Bathyarchaeota archaeon]
MGENILTGIGGLDLLVDGGFPSGSLILLAGNPGTGKTVFSAQFIYRGAADYGENGVYVSFAESREVFLRNMLDFGFNFEELERQGKFKFLDMTTMKEEGVSSALELLLNEVHRLDAKRLVIDSFSAMAQAFEKPIDVRMAVHLVLNRLVRQLGCTTLIIVEVPMGSERVGVNVEEFVADGILMLRRDEVEGRLIRKIEVLKLRGRRLKDHRYVFTLDGGFKVFPSFALKEIGKPRPFKPLPDTPTHFSTGIIELDEALGGGYPRGSIVLLEVDENVPRGGVSSILNPVRLNFINNDNGVFSIPSAGLSADYVKEGLEPYADRRLFNRNVRIVEFEEESQEPYTIALRGRSIMDDYEKFWEHISTFKAETGKPVLGTIGYDTLEYTYPDDTAILIQQMVKTAKRIRVSGDLRINIVRPAMKITPHARYISDMYFKLVEVDGSLCLYGLKPRTGIYNIEVDVKEEYPKTRLTPII